MNTFSVPVSHAERAGMSCSWESAFAASSIQEALGSIPSTESTGHGGVCLCSQLEGGEGKRLRNPQSSLAVYLVQSQAGIHEILS